MNRKSKGISGEREIIHALWALDWAAHRIAGSGSSKYPSPDIIAGNGGRILAIECKVCNAQAQYFSKMEIEQLGEFAKKFGAEPYVAVKFSRIGWFFLNPLHLKETPQSFVLSRESAMLFGKSAKELVGQNIQG